MNRIRRWWLRYKLHLEGICPDHGERLITHDTCDIAIRVWGGVRPGECVNCTKERNRKEKELPSLKARAREERVNKMLNELKEDKQ